MTEAPRGFLAALWDDDGIDPGVRAAVLLRDGYHCTRCGVLVTRRKFGVALRNEDAGPVTENLVTACAPCRRCISLHQDPEDGQNGLRLWPEQDPAATPLRRHGSDHPEWLLPDGGISFEDPEEASAA